MPYNIEMVVSIINERDNWNTVDIDLVLKVAKAKKGAKTLTDRQVQIIINEFYPGHVHGMLRGQMYQWITQPQEEI